MGPLLRALSWLLERVAERDIDAMTMAEWEKQREARRRAVERSKVDRARGLTMAELGLLRKEAIVERR